MARDPVNAALDNARVVFTGEEDLDGSALPDLDALPDPAEAGVNPDIVRKCALLDQSDTDNGHRLIEHFGADLRVVAAEGSDGGDWLYWTGAYWDQPNGRAQAIATAQRLGGRIGLEVAALRDLPEFVEAFANEKTFKEDDESRAAKAARKAAEICRKRLHQRWAFSVSSKNGSRIREALNMASVHIRRPARDFNREPLCFACETHTIRLIVEADGGDMEPRKACHVEARAGHERGDFLTGLVPAPYDPAARAPKFLAFLSQCVPDADARRTLQAYSGTGLLGLLLQRLMFHYGSGANGKSVFLAVLRRLLGSSLAVGLPKETILGQGERGAGQASPDLIRLFGKRAVFVDEMKEGEPLREDLVKRLTGGDPVPVRGMYSGYIEFANVATPHLVGNGMPDIKGADNGIWRRVIVMPWTVTIPEESRRDFEEFVGELLEERAGILNWLIDGARDTLANGLFIAEAARMATEAYRDDSDQIGGFIKRCVEIVAGEKVQARQMYQAYSAWARANAMTPRHETKFGRDARKHLGRSDGAIRFYLDCRLKPEALEMLAREPPPGPPPEGE